MSKKSEKEECIEFETFKGEMDRLIEGLSKDAEKFYNKDNKAAGVRLRKALKNIKLFVQDVSNGTAPKNKL